MLAVGMWKLLQEIAQCSVAFVKQALAPGFHAMQCSRFAVCVFAIVIERGTQRFKFRFVEFAQLFGQELRFAFARNLLGDTSNPKYLLAQFVRQWQVRQLCGGKFDQRLRQLEYIQGGAPTLATADFTRFDLTF